MDKMARFGLIFGLFFVGGVFTAARSFDINEDCGDCIQENCPETGTCVAGIVLDNCRCCRTCAKTEYELCRHDDVPGSERHGVCGENLECRPRTDLLTQEAPEALCYCMQNEAVCGDDGVSKKTYNNQCQLTAVARAKGIEITVVGKGPCDATPEIVTRPENTHNATGDNVVLSCEARGFPIPTVEWSWTRVDGHTQFLPNDDVHVSVNMRGGPERFTVTGWLQIMDVQKEHEGDYTCVAQNAQGMAQATARLKVSRQAEDEKRRRTFDRDNDL